MNKEKGIGILSKKYWKVICPDEFIPTFQTGVSLGSYSEDKPNYIGIKQSEFLKQYDPAGHKVNSVAHYPNIIKKDEDTGLYYEEKISRVAFSFQQIILTKQLNALCGNPTKFRLSNAIQTAKDEEVFSLWKEGWAAKDMDILLYKAYKSIGKTGDGAIYIYLNKEGKIDHRIFSFDKGDLLFPHYSNNGKLELFARRYTGVNEYGHEESRIDVFTDKEVFNLVEDNSDEGYNSSIKFLNGKYTVDGYRLATDTPIKHGLPFVPIAYYRDEDGAWWSKSQKTIEEFEWAFSCLTHSNMAFAFPIMYIKGSDVEIEGDMIRNTVKGIFLPNKDSEAGFLNRPDGSSSFELQLTKLYDLIFQQSFSVNPPEVRSGDLPGVAIKLLYSPSIEKASEMSRNLNTFLDQVVDMFTYMYGIETNKLSEFKKLNVYAFQEPYVHQNDSELMKNLETGTNSGFISRKTATEASPYSNNNEIQRLKEEVDEEDRNDLLGDFKFTIDGDNERKLLDNDKSKAKGENIKES